MTLDLRFRRALGPQPGGAVALVFGATSSAPPPPPPPPPPPLPGAVRMFAGATWQGAAPAAGPGTSAAWRDTVQPLRCDRSAPWGAGARSGTAALASWGRAAPQAPLATAAGWQSAQLLRGAVLAPWGQAVVMGRTWGSGWSPTADAHVAVLAPWQRALAQAGWALAAWQGGRPVQRHVVVSADQARPAIADVRAPWQMGLRVISFGGPWHPLAPLPPTPCWVPEPGEAVTLVLRHSLRQLAELLFACRRAALAVIPVRRVYMVTNVTTLVRVDTGDSVPCYGFSLTLDVDSWAWGFSAELKASALPLLQPDAPGEPVVLEASVNGLPFRVIPRSVSRQRSGPGEPTLRVDGVGHTAVLAEPFSAVTTFGATAALTSQQLADQAMPAGWTVDWGVTAWLVPGGVWSHQGTPASAALAIAAAAGAYVLPHPNQQRIAVLPRYPLAPWAWAGATPDIELPAAVVINEGTSWTDLPRYNGVYVSGTGPGGVLRLVRRTGTAGDVLAPMVTDRLITHADAARQRGLPVLANTGGKAMLSLGLPVLQATGVIQPGKLVRYMEGTSARVGLVRGVRVEVSAGGDRKPVEVWQTINLETQES